VILVGYGIGEKNEDEDKDGRQVLAVTMEDEMIGRFHSLTLPMVLTAAP